MILIYYSKSYFFLVFFFTLKLLFIFQIRKRNEEEIELLKHALKRIGEKQENGDYKTTFGTIFKDDEVANTFEGISATLKNAKQRGIVKYASPLLLQGAHDNVEIILLAEFVPQ